MWVGSVGSFGGSSANFVDGEDGKPALRVPRNRQSEPVPTGPLMLRLILEGFAQMTFRTIKAAELGPEQTRHLSPRCSQSVSSAPLSVQTLDSRIHIGNVINALVAAAVLAVRLRSLSVLIGMPRDPGGLQHMGRIVCDLLQVRAG